MSGVASSPGIWMKFARRRVGAEVRVVSLKMPFDLLERLDREARGRGATRSDMIRRAVRTRSMTVIPG